jgi:pyruvate dehydrogenase E2 component (dihydrolipoamide acetyltransferase)
MPEITMPKLSDTMTEGTLVAWKKKKGDNVSAGDVLAEIETDKATMEWESSDDGVLTEIYIDEGGKVSVGDRIALILGKGEAPPAGNGATAKPAPAKTPAPADKGAPASESTKPVAAAPSVATASTPSPTQGRVKASPLARKLAAEHGIDLTSLTGSGPGSRIVQKDVLSAGTQPKAAPSTAASVPQGMGSQNRIQLSGMRRTIAERLLASKTQIPHFYLNIEVDAAPLMKIRSEVNAASEGMGLNKLTVNDFILKAVATAVARVPKVNATFDKDAIVEFGSINLAVAVAVEDGLVTPVIRDAQTKSLRQFSDAVKDLATRARNKKLKPEEYQGGTITVSNLGSYGIDSFSAIINPPQAVILSVGAIVKKPVVDAKDQIVPGQRLSIGMSCDHRVVDGAIGAQFLAELRRVLENPVLMLI